MQKIKLMLALHNHQPPDNFEKVVEEAFRRSYEPFLDCLEKYPGVKVTLHYSGSLLEWFEKNRPRFIDRINKLVHSRRVELLTGGFHEPILTMIPQPDRDGQIRQLTEFIKTRFDFIPKGIWVAERVWDTSLGDCLKGHGLRYTMVDENQIEFPGGTDKKCGFGYYELSNGLKAFSINKKLRYIIPFAKIKDLLGYFKDISSRLGEVSMLFGDDGEKFGMWPRTYDWVYGRKWLEGFFQLLSDENSCVTTMTCSEALDAFKPEGTANVPRSSYSEMMEWSKGDFANFFTEYPESNLMRLRMLYLSEKIKHAGERNLFTTKQKEALFNARQELYKAQAGCAYWHGVFGGVYHGHLRSGVYRHLITAQNLMETVDGGKSVGLYQYDFDGDGSDEYMLSNKFINIYVKPGSSGTVFGLDNRTRALNLMNTMRRKKEPYHSKVVKRSAVNLRSIRDNISSDKYHSIYDIIGLKTRGLKKYLVYDEYLKSSFIDYFSKNKFTLRDFSGARYDALHRISSHPYRVRSAESDRGLTVVMEKEEAIDSAGVKRMLNITKDIGLAEGPEFYVRYVFENLSGGEFSSEFFTECNLSVFNRAYLRDRAVRNIKDFRIKDEWSGSETILGFSRPVDIWTVPVYTINESEAGIDRQYQSLGIMITLPVKMLPGEKKDLKVNIKLG